MTEKVNAEISWTLRQISNYDCRSLYRISNWCVYQNCLSRYTEKL